MTYRATLRELADAQYGYITTREASDLGVPGVELRKLANRGVLRQVRRGVYRFPDARRTDLDAYAEAVARVGEGAFLMGDAVLGLLGLALVEPRRIKVGTPNRVRQKDPGFVDVVWRAFPRQVLTTYEGIAATTVAQALIDARGTVMADRLRDATNQAFRAGLLTHAEANRVRAALRRPAQTGRASRANDPKADDHRTSTRPTDGRRAGGTSARSGTRHAVVGP